ncbi:YitT family protein [Ruminiclostridium papyrosolvens]|uniref:Membrane protein n=1 Tax=Ruminiclostridium papyrosolvens C7 TaxID=1330534 RepID=U4R2I0_9FIRM|nr:YitT family protein [Ruminiclostridium papyrosolvens]EPR12594.1 membrane protein [Ruminiclostridium papyrosolvens C7]
MNEKKYSITKKVVNYLFIFLGALLTAVGVEIFFSSHNLIAGGIIGTAVMISYIMEIPIGAIIVLLNFPFVIFGYRHKGKKFLLPTILAAASMIFWLSVFRSVQMEQQYILQSTIFGGIFLGMGLGLILRFGALVDGFKCRRKYYEMNGINSFGTIYIAVNLLIVSLSGLVFGWEQAIYSLIAYFIVFKSIDVTFDLLKRDSVVAGSEQNVR